MTDIDILVFLIIWCFAIFAFGMFMGYTCDDNKLKNPITAFFDGYTIVMPSILMIAFGAPVLLGAWSFIMMVISAFRFVSGNFEWTDNTVIAFSYGCYMCFCIFWTWFRERVLGHEPII